jgi:diguanylate cyclase (GGDEF)-like protein
MVAPEAANGGAVASLSGTSGDAPQRRSAGPPLPPVPHLELLQGAATLAAEHVTLAGAAAEIVRLVCSLTGWPAGQLHTVGTAGMPPPSTLPATARQVMATGRPEWSADGGKPVRGAAVAVPVAVGGEVVAVLEFSTESPGPPDDTFLEVLAGVGNQLARVVEREQAHEALRQSEERLRALAESAEVERRGFERQLAERALRDPLTSLPNRALLLDRLEVALARAGRVGLSVAVLLCDLDRFRSVNDSFGHPTGDRLLAAVAERLERGLRPGDTVARMGGDEFAVLGEDLEGPAEAAELARRVQEVFAVPFALGDTDVWVTASTGVASSGGGGDGELLLREATVAVGRAKRRGRGRVEVFDDAMRAAAPWHQATEHELRDAIAGGQLRLVYQPIVTLADGELVGVEALVRWQHPSRGLLTPVDFIGLAEESGLTVPLGAWVLEEACRQAAEWRRVREADRPLTLNVNVSVQQVGDDGWPQAVGAVLAATGLPPSRLVLEITESILMHDSEASSARLGRLRELGVRLAIDDFGTGYSSLAYLRHMPVDFLKIDKSFVDGVTGDPHESALARAVVKLASTLGLSAIAEGIEHRSQAELLKALGCRYGQGYWLGMPQSPEAITERLKGQDENDLRSS